MKNLKVMAVVSFSDILFHAEKLGFFWNQAHELMVSANLYVGHLTLEHCQDGYYMEEGTHIEARRILQDFLQKHQIQEVYVAPKNHDVSW